MPLLLNNYSPVYNAGAKLQRLLPTPHHNGPVNILSSILFLWVLLLLTSCTPDKLQKPLNYFQTSTKVAATATAGYYNELNSFEQELYLKDQALDASSTDRIVEIDNQGLLKPTGLFKAPFSPKAIQARVALLKGLSDYAAGLSKLAGNESSDDFKANVTSLEAGLKDLQTTFSKLTKAEDPNAGKYVGPLSTIAKFVGELMLKVKQDKYLRKAVIDGEVPINSLLDFLAEDLKTYVEPLRQSGMDQILAGLVKDYYDTKKTATFEQRQSQLMEIKKTAVSYQLTLNNTPSGVIEQLKRTHIALVQAAKTPTPVNLGLLLAAVKEYESQVQDLADAVKKIQELNKPQL